MDAIERIYQRVAEKTGKMTYEQKKRLRAKQYYYEHREEILLREREARARGEGKKYRRYRRTSLLCSRAYYYEHREEILLKRHNAYIEKLRRKQEA